MYILLVSEEGGRFMRLQPRLNLRKFAFLLHVDATGPVTEIGFLCFTVSVTWGKSKELAGDIPVLHRTGRVLPVATSASDDEDHYEDEDGDFQDYEDEEEEAAPT